jgi:hypothetical protein
MELEASSNGRWLEDAVVNHGEYLKDDEKLGKKRWI